MSDERPLPALRLADRLDRLQPGEMIAVGRDGNVIDRRARLRRSIVPLAMIGGFTTWAIITAPAIGIAYAAFVGGWMGWAIRRGRSINKIARLIRAQRFDEAEQAIGALERSSWRGRGIAAFYRAMLAHRRGDLEGAVAAARRCEQILTAPDKRTYYVYWTNAFVLASLLYELGRLDEAGPVLERAQRAPDGEIYRSMKRALEAQRAFATGRHEELGTDDDLHDRAREALRYNHTGFTIALLAWAYDQRGDAEMCAHLAGEVASRCPDGGVEAMERLHPRVWTWLAPRLPVAEDDE